MNIFSNLQVIDLYIDEYLKRINILFSIRRTISRLQHQGKLEQRSR